MNDTSAQRGSPTDQHLLAKHFEPARQTDKTLGIPVPTLEERDATLAGFAKKRWTEVKHGRQVPEEGQR